MGSEALEAPSSAAYASGAGGKLRRPFSRKLPSTPYDRPLTLQRRSAATGGGGGWMSKIVNPAYRLIAGGAARLLPSVFSSTSTSLPALLPSPNAAKEGLEQGTRNENQESPIHLCISKSTANEGASEQEGRPDVFESAEVGRGKSQYLAGDPDLSNIEQLIKGKTFCSEEIDRLMGILQSRVGDAEGRGLISNASTAEKADKVEIPIGNLKLKTEGKQETLDEDNLPNLTPLLQQTANDEIGASPIELAKAYMGSRASQIDIASKSQVPKNDILFPLTNELSSNQVLPPPSPKPSICWPGAIVQEQHDFLTPHSHRGRYGLSNHPRTPYSRTIYSRSTSKLIPLEGCNWKLSHTAVTPFQKQTPLYGESRVRAREDVQGSVGPIRRLRHKFVSETPRRGSPSLWSSQKASPQVKESIPGDNPLAINPVEPTAVGTSFLSTEHKGLSNAGTSVVHPQTSKLAHEILEKLSRTPTPKEKSEELRLVIAKKNSLTSEVSGAKDAAATSYAAEFLQDREKESPLLKVPCAILPSGGISGTDGDSTDSRTLQKSSFSFHNIRPSTTSQDSSQGFFSGSSLAAAHQSWLLLLEIQIPLPNRGPVAVTNRELNVRKASMPSGTKPVLPPIFVDKSNNRVRFASDNCSSGFTFPVAASTGPSEPPTPSIMPLSSGKPPTYTFGEKKFGATLVFAFPTTSIPSTPHDAPVFQFGSDASRVSFCAVGKDAICC